MLKFEPQTQRQHQLVGDLKQYHSKQKQLGTVIQFSERNQEYFTANIKSVMDALQETVDKPLVYDPETGEVQFKEE